MAKNKKWSSAAKFEIELQAIKGETTLNKICERYSIAPSQVHAWKKQFIEQGQEVFEKKKQNGSKKVVADQERKQGLLYEKIGQLTVERDYLKKSWDKYQDNDDES